MRAQPTRLAADALVALAMVLPTLGAWIYFVALQGHALARPAYLAAKLLQFSLPVLWWVVARRGPLRIERRPGWRRATVAGLVSGAVLALALAALYSVLSGRSAITADAAERIRTTLVEFRIVTPAGFVALAAGLAVVHSLLEEVYWRAFVYRRLGGWLPPRLALALASAAFASHHLIVAARYTPAGHFWSLTLPATVAVALAGAHWADLYRRTGSLLAPWTSHLVVDTALMGIGYALVWGGDG